MKEIKIEAKTTKEAIEKGLKELNLSREEVEVEIVREEKKGILGIGAKDACVIIRPKVWNRESKENNPRSTKEIQLPDGFKPTGNVKEDIRTLLTEIFTRSKIDFKIMEELFNETENKVYINFQSKDAGILLYEGAKGLLSLQQIINIIINKDQPKKLMVKIDTEEFWTKTELKLKKDVEHAIEFINRTKKPYKMKPMPSSFRKIIHDIVQKNYPDYTTCSYGHSKFRRVVIRKQKKENQSQENNNKIQIVPKENTQDVQPQ